jgi:uncharacterized protein (TIGR00251 family)
MNVPVFLREESDGAVLLAVKVQPRAPKNEICGVIGNELKVKIAAPPVDSAANEALVRFVAETLGCPRNAVRLVRGANSRHKALAITGVGTQRIVEQLHC